MKNKFVKLLAISAFICGSVSCKDEVAAIGQKAPDIAAYDLQGKEVKLDDWKGTRLLTFWSETCGRCVAMPSRLRLPVSLPSAISANITLCVFSKNT